MISARLERYVRATFGDDADAVLEALAAWRISYLEEPPVERLQAAVVQIAESDPERIREGMEIAERDWRDLLVWSGLGNVGWERVLGERLGPHDDQLSSTS